jgi:hypothetical protein
MFDRVWKMLQEIKATEIKKAFDAIIEILSSSEDEEMLQLKDDLLAFEDDILDDSEDPIKTLLESEVQNERVRLLILQTDLRIC